MIEIPVQFNPVCLERCENLKSRIELHADIVDITNASRDSLVAMEVEGIDYAAQKAALLDVVLADSLALGSLTPEEALAISQQVEAADTAEVTELAGSIIDQQLQDNRLFRTEKLFELGQQPYGKGIAEFVLELQDDMDQKRDAARTEHKTRMDTIYTSMGTTEEEFLASRLTLEQRIEETKADVAQGEIFQKSDIADFEKCATCTGATNNCPIAK